MLTNSIKIFLLGAGIIITGSIAHVLIPLMARSITSLYFLIMLIAVEGTLVYLSILGTMIFITKHNTFCVQPSAIPITIQSGIAHGFMAICLIYSANPERTPVVIQSIFAGIAVIPSVIFTHIFLNKNVTYDLKYIIPSLIFLTASIAFVTVPLFISTSVSYVANLGWILMYACGIILFSLTNVLQEKYVIETADSTFENKIRFATYSGLFQIITLGLMFWIDVFIGYGDGFESFIYSIITLVTNTTALGLVQLFVFDCIVLFVISIYLNEISTNYNMIITNITSQSVALFFTIWPQFNTGLHYPLYITVLSIGCNVCSAIIWMKGETHD